MYGQQNIKGKTVSAHVTKSQAWAKAYSPVSSFLSPALGGDELLASSPWRLTAKDRFPFPLYLLNTHQNLSGLFAEQNIPPLPAFSVSS